MICICWAGLTQYAARIIGSFVDEAHDEVVVIANRPRMPLKEIDQYAHCPIVWVENGERRSLKEVLGRLPETLFVSGWFVPTFNRFRDEVQGAGGQVYALVDNNYQLDLKAVFKAIRFRLLHRGRYRGFLVPGRSGRKLLRFYGVGDSKIATGLYSADETHFRAGVKLVERERRMLYIGQLIERKNIVRMCQAFAIANAAVGGGWKLELFGKGSLKDSVPSNDSIMVHDFVQPEELPQIYQRARVFVLPSIEEHWGLVVHEAALSGCALLLSDRVGALPDLLGARNGCSFTPFSVRKMSESMIKIMSWDVAEWNAAYDESLALGNKICRKNFAEGVNQLLRVT